MDLGSRRQFPLVPGKRDQKEKTSCVCAISLCHVRLIESNRMKLGSQWRTRVTCASFFDECKQNFCSIIFKLIFEKFSMKNSFGCLNFYF